MGQVWCCLDPDCEYTKPRWIEDQVKDLLEGGVKCICGGKMKLREGGMIAVQPLEGSESDDRSESTSAGKG